MERGIASHLLSRSPMPNTPFTSLSPSVMEWCLRAMYTSWKLRPLSGGVLSLIILVPPLVLRAMDSSYRRSSRWSSSLFLLTGGPTSIPSSQPRGYSLRPVSGTYFFANASFNKGHTHPHDFPFPPQMIRWPQASPSVSPVALATPAQRNPVPSWLPTDSKTLYQQGLEALTTEDALHNANPAH